jgi:predicted phage terminase large subunit-like protein
MSRTQSGLYFIEHVLRGQWSPRGVESVVLQTAKQDGTAVRIRMEQEPGSSGKMVVENWIKLLAGYDVGAVPATGEKSTRWRPLSAQCEAGNVKLVQGPWVEPWLQEMERVPQEGQHDDQADSASIAFNDLTVGQTNTAILEYYQQVYQERIYERLERCATGDLVSYDELSALAMGDVRSEKKSVLDSIRDQIRRQTGFVFEDVPATGLKRGNQQG